jgi:hypothetical protein
LISAFGGNGSALADFSSALGTETEMDMSTDGSFNRMKAITVPGRAVISAISPSTQIGPSRPMYSPIAAETTRTGAGFSSLVSMASA